MILKDNEKNHFEVQAQSEIEETYYLFLSDCTSVTCKQHIFLVHFAKLEITTFIKIVVFFKYLSCFVHFYDL